MVAVSDRQPPERPEVSAIDQVRLDPRLRTRDDSGITAVSLGMLAWAIAWLVVTFALPETDDSWQAITAAGFILGALGWVFLVVRQRRKQRRGLDQE